MSQARAMIKPFLTPYITITGTGIGMGMGRTVRHSAYRYGPDYSGTFSNSQFSVSIFNLTKTLAHFVTGGRDGPL
ncbi:hypothetical protein LCGC14_2376420 [marine sediment metagenome]|uniref:Uncharacterized protein n=1 Tax=marine sediment metagenome TaxID=412755 RepID=A0A0F9EEN9_9ZZZZ